MSDFKDLFSKQAAIYAKYRPTYPKELFDYVVSLVECHGRVWDCGCGNGQASIELAKYFDKVIATDGSAEQVKHATPFDNVEYAVAKEENPELADHSVDMVTVAQAIHWFDFPVFFKEVKRVLKPGGVLIAWGYGHCDLSNAGIQVLSKEFYDVITEPYWAPERHYIDEAYKTLPKFPGEEMTTKQFHITRDWTADDFLNYLRTWSPVNTLEKETGENLVDSWMKPRVDALDLGDELLKVQWPIIMKASLVT